MTPPRRRRDKVKGNIEEGLAWRIMSEALVPLGGQPEEGFGGPGKAYLWMVKEKLDMSKLGVEMFVVRDDGARPFGLDTKSPRRSYVKEVVAA